MKQYKEDQIKQLLSKDTELKEMKKRMLNLNDKKVDEITLESKYRLKLKYENNICRKKCDMLNETFVYSFKKWTECEARRIRRTHW